MDGPERDSLHGRSRGRASFFSRKNRVVKSLRDGQMVVVKTYPRADSGVIRKEYMILERCLESGVLAPTPIAMEDNAIVMSYVDGRVLSTVLDSHWVHARPGRSAPEADPVRIAESLGRWLHGFHAAFEFGLRRGDVNMRNFVLSEDGMYGLDFEEASEGDVIEDLGQACATVLSMDPMFTEEKSAFAGRMAGKYFEMTGIERYDDLRGAVVRALRYYASFRKNRAAVEAFASRVEREGLPFSE
jgi:tRNA A-37 threonylcarbamoyl transferase component Bud32